MGEENKKIDGEWKEAVEKEKDALKGKNISGLPEPDFNFFITTLALQASIAIGDIPNPNTNKKEESLNQAKLLIDTLDILKEKTKGNLTSEENKLLENVIYELKMRYIAKMEGGKT